MALLEAAERSARLGKPKSFRQKRAEEELAQQESQHVEKALFGAAELSKRAGPCYHSSDSWPLAALHSPEEPRGCLAPFQARSHGWGGQLTVAHFFRFQHSGERRGAARHAARFPPPIPLPLLANKDTPLEEDLSEAEEEMVKAEG